MPGSKLRALFVVFLCACVANSIAAQSKAPKPVSGRAITMWRETNSTPDLRQVTLLFYVRNDTTVPIALTQARILGCVNVTVSCDTLRPQLIVLMPSEVWFLARLEAVTPGTPMDAKLD